MSKSYSKYKGKTIYTCKVNGCLGRNALCRHIACSIDECRAHGLYKCEHKVKKQ